MNRVVHFEVQADDIQRAKKFYENAFGWKVEQYMSKEKGGMEYWGLSTGDKSELGINGGMYQRPAGEVKAGDKGKQYLFDCTITVEDIDKAVAAVKANGGTITREKIEMPGIGWFANAKDTEGNQFSLMQATMKM